MLGKRLDYQVEENKIHFFFEKEEAFLEVITESIINVFVPYETKGHRSKAIEGEKAVRTDFEVKTAAVMFQLQQNSWKREFMTDFMWTFTGMERAFVKITAAGVF